jgi:hypothetical protein
MTFRGDAANAATLQTGRNLLGLSYTQLWVDYYALGGNHGLGDFEAWLTGGTALSSTNYDMVAVALNERFMDRNSDHPIPYSDEL